MKAILILVLGIIVVFLVLRYYQSKTAETLKPILPTVFFEPAGDTSIIVIDFGACAPAKGSVDGDFGTIKVEVWSWDVDTCRLDYASSKGEIYRISCLVPKSIGHKRFKKNFAGINFSEISQYCKVI